MFTVNTWFLGQKLLPQLPYFPWVKALGKYDFRVIVGQWKMMRTQQNMSHCCPQKQSIFVYWLNLLSLILRSVNSIIHSSLYILNIVISSKLEFIIKVPTKSVDVHDHVPPSRIIFRSSLDVTGEMSVGIVRLPMLLSLSSSCPYCTCQIFPTL